MDWGMIAGSGAGKKMGRAYRQFPPITLSGFPHGLNTSVLPNQIQRTECSELVNFGITRGGQIQTRSPIILHTTAAPVVATKYPVEVSYCPIGSTYRELIVDSAHNLYYNNAGTPTTVGAAPLSGATRILPFAGVAILFDGSYIKYVDGVAANSIKIAYDNGSGPSSYQHNNRTGSDDSGLAVGNGTNTRAAATFTTQSWDAGYTIPPTTFFAFLQRIGNGFTGTDNVPIYARIRRTSDDSIIAAKILVAAPIATNLSATAAEYEITFSASDITTPFLPSTQYRLSIEYANGDAANYVSLRCSTVSAAGVGSHYAAAAWSADATYNPIIAVRPGRPPKASFGVVHNSRIFAAGDSSTPGICYFSNLSFLDWSTPDAAGYVGSVDDNSNSYPIGAIISLYNELYVFGTEAQPFICKLTGSTPSAYRLPSTFQHSWASHKAAALTPNDAWFATSSNLSNFSGVQEFGDMRTAPFADPVLDRFRRYYSSASIMEYDGSTGCLWLSFPSYHRVLICHTLTPSRISGAVRYPWSEFEFTLHHLSNTNLYKFVASSNGTNEYYLQLPAGGDPSIIASPDAVLLDGRPISSGTVGSLSDHSWGYDDNDTLGYSTIYFRDDSGAPSATAVDLRTCIIPTMLRYINGTMMIGCSDGNIYKVDRTGYKELDLHQMRFDVRTAYITPHIDAVIIDRITCALGGLFGGRFSFGIYADSQFNSPGISSLTYSMQIDDRLTISDMTMDVEDAYFLVDSGSELLQEWVGVECYSMQFRLHNILLSGDSVTLNGIEAYIRPLDM